MGNNGKNSFGVVPLLFLAFMFGFGPCTPSSCKIGSGALMRAKSENNRLKRELEMAKSENLYYISTEDRNGDGLLDITLRYHTRNDIYLDSGRGIFERIEYRIR